MTTTTIEIKDKTLKTFSAKNLETFVNSNEFEDLVLGYQMTKGETGKTESYSSFKKELGL